MKHRLPIPFPDDILPLSDLGSFLRRHGWEIKSYEFIGMSVIRFGGEMKYLRITIAPQPTSIAAADMTMIVTSGATLVYDDAEDTMGVTLRPEPCDAPRARIEDEVAVLYKPGDTIHMVGQPPEVLGKVVSLAPERVRGEPVYSILIYGGDFASREFPHSHAVVQSQIEPADDLS